MIAWLNFAVLFACSFLFSFVYVPVWYSWCRAEERDLLIRYGAAYAEYMDRVGFRIPRRALRNRAA
jgi:protein-S-isoprenylcysteine O-methyltransferase Ste14